MLVCDGHTSHMFSLSSYASPLITLPMAIYTEPMIGEEDISHRDTDLTTLFSTELFLFLPQITSTQTWEHTLYPLGTKKNAQDIYWAYRGVSSLVENKEFFQNYLVFWRSAFDAYQQRDVDRSIYWLTNGCGQPVPRPGDWPRRTGSGYESVSDAKTSVGMDRTDDIKKATYQVLKLGAAGKPSIQYNYKVGIVSNIHAARHFDEYLNSFKDIIWTREKTGNVSTVGELAPETALFNLFDGIVTLTDVLARDQWIKQVFTI